MLKNMLISKDKYSLKCPYDMQPVGICVHNTYNDASALNEVKYMQSNNNSTSFHIAIDDKESILAIPLNRNAWHSGDGNGQGNRKHISIEICYSKSGGVKFSNAEKRAAKEISELLKQYNWGIDRVKKHQDFSNKYCPHRTLDLGWQRFINMVKAEMNNNDNGGYIMKVYQNGSTKETVYETSKCLKSIGYLEAKETCNCIGEIEGKAIVLYNTSNGKKTGFVKWLGGIK